MRERGERSRVALLFFFLNALFVFFLQLQVCQVDRSWGFGVAVVGSGDDANSIKLNSSGSKGGVSVVFF